MDGFPAGLRVLVVDDDPTWLKILEKMLKKCSYEVTTCGRARAALDKLRERKNRFDIVISDVNMPDMDGFKLLEHVGLEMDLPVIMMSVDGETSRVMKGVQHGACDYLLKPIRMKELRIIWQHVYRKKINEGKENGSHDHEGNDSTQMMKNGLDDFEDEFFLSDSDPNCTKKRKEMGNEVNDGQEFSSNPGTVKKVRVVWSVELHKKFVSAVNQIGFDKVGPKKILDMMNVPGLTRENVASHLQKYRLYLSRIQKRNEPNTSFCGINPDFRSEDHPGNFGLQSSMTTQHNSPSNSGYCCINRIVQDVIPDISKEKEKSIGSFLPATEAKSSLRVGVPVSQKLNSVPQPGIVCPFGCTVPDADCTSFGSSISQQQPWSGKSSVVQLPDADCTSFGSPISQQQPWSGKSSVVQLIQQAKEEHKPDLEHPHLKLHSQEHHSQVYHKKRTISANGRTYMTDTDVTGSSEIEPFCTDYKRSHVRSVYPLRLLTDSCSAPLEHKIEKPLEFGARPLTDSSSSTKNHDPIQHSINGWGSPQSSTLKNGSFSASSHEDFQHRSLESYGRFENVWLDEMEFVDFSASSISELQSYVYDGLRFNCDYQGDMMEYPVIGEGVFIA